MTPEEASAILLEHLPKDGRSIGNVSLLRTLQGVWPSATDTFYKSAKDVLIMSGRAIPGRGRGGSLRRPSEADSHGSPDEQLSGGHVVAGQYGVPLRIGNGVASNRGLGLRRHEGPKQLSLLEGYAVSASDESEAFLSDQIITYIGNKRALLEFIGKGIRRVEAAVGKESLDTFDVFSGSGIVARYLKQFSRKIYASDLEKYSAVANCCYLTNKSTVDLNEIREIVSTVNAEAKAHLREGLVTQLYAPRDDNDIKLGERVFYTRRNAMMIDTVRALIDEIVPGHLKLFVMAPLLYAASVHANTSGVFKGFYKNSQTGVGQFGGNGRDALARICKPFELMTPVFSNYECEYEVFQGDSLELARSIPEVDLAYLDPPYNQHPYGSNYFMLNLIECNTPPQEVSAVSGIPTNWNRSEFNKRPRAKTAMRNIISSINARYLLISFNSEGFIKHEEMLAMLNEVGPTEAIETRYNTFRGSRNLQNRNIHVSEYLYLVKKER